MATLLNLCSGGSLLLGTIPGVFSWRLHFQKDDQFLSIEKKNLIKSNIQELAKKLGISKPIELIEKKGFKNIAQAQGIALFSGRAGIVIDPYLTSAISEAELEFIIAHELSHIKANDLIWMGVVPSIVGVITTLGMSILFPSSATYFSPIVMAALMVSSPAAVVGLSVSIAAFAIFSKWREECADKLGLSTCSDAAQKAAPKFFEKIRNEQINYRNNDEGSYFSRLWKRFLITENGESRFEIFHPSFKNRINYCNIKMNNSM